MTCSGVSSFPGMAGSRPPFAPLLTSVHGQTFHRSEHVIAHSPGSGILSRPESLQLGVLQDGGDIFHPWKTVVPPGEGTAGRRRSAVGTGAAIGFPVGMVAGIVIWANRKCEGMACLAKPLGFPM